MKPKHVLPLLLASAAASFGAMYSASSDAAVRTIAGGGCRRLGNGYNCSIPTGFDFSTANFLDGYVDYSSSESTYVEVRFERRSYTGSYSTDTEHFTSTGQVDHRVPLVAIKRNPSVWDYVNVSLIQPPGPPLVTLTGVAINAL